MNCVVKIMSQLNHIICPACGIGILTVVAEVGEKILKSIIKRQIAFLIGSTYYRCNNDILLRFFVYPRSEQCHLVDYFIRRQ